MNKKIFVDTGAWFAIADKSDQFHQKASNHINQLVEQQTILITSNFVIHETIMLLYRKICKEAAYNFLQTIYNDDDMERDAYGIFQHYVEHDFSITACVSFVMMKKFGIRHVFTFDKHFKTMRFIVSP
jgi:uncharacterized protein